MDFTWANELLGLTFFDNTVLDYLVAAGIFIAVAIVARLTAGILLGRWEKLASRTAFGLDDFVIGLLKRRLTAAVYLVLGLYFSAHSLALPAGMTQAVTLIFVVFLTVKAIQIIQSAAEYFVSVWLRRAQQDNPTTASMVRNITIIVRALLWVAGVLFILDNLGINITAFVAGLGVGGVAVALAAQAVLGDAFSSFAIYMDRPFEVGDFIIVGDLLGSVEHVGIKTTRIRSLGGEQLIFSNSDLTSSRVKNYKRMQERRVLFKLGVTYQTTTKQVTAIPTLIEDVVRAHTMTRFDRAHFQSYGDFALVFEIVYYVLSPDYNIYMDVQQFINVRIKDVFEREGIEFAYPTQLVYLTKTQPEGAAAAT
ncbi:MAG TPA: mechanosensitive ion channel family protein [bacterium]